MLELGIKSNETTLRDLGIADGIAYWNLNSDQLISITLKKGQGQLDLNGALAIDTGEFTGRSPKDKFIVKDELTENTVWWNNFNIPFAPEKFDQLYIKMIRYFEGKEMFVRDAFACADWRYRINIRIINEYAWSNLFAYNMFLRPTAQELSSFTADWLILNAPGFKANPQEDGTRQHNFSIIDFKRRIVLIGGSGYTGEIKKSIFSVLNYVLPEKKNVLPMHCSANIGEQDDTAIFFGLSGTGKTTLSADPNRKLIGDDEHGWTPDNMIFNFEGGCYAKTIDLSQEKEPDIFNAIRKGALLENVCFKENSNEVNFSDCSKTENTRVSYPLEFINHIAVPSIGTNPKNIFFLTCDAFGILPPISKLTPSQAAFHFISGYTAKVAGTETDVTEPTMTFSTCFGAPFMPLHPTRYATMLSKKIKQGNVNVWLVNTGWTGGPYGTGKRISLKYTRALINAALNGSLNNVEYKTHELFGFNMPVTCPEVPDQILNPRNTWEDKDEYDAKAYYLANAFMNNFEKYAGYADEEILKGAPPIRVTA
ncbi:phosphoenolpyruvate carboxykinase (ATP) [Chryseosolibacter indicus]|uniref:Phosphoenolpyruvate carboxykinase (ATP) n=1 Tax=Chryseosolibacter indicus TaxID=2782351 RepID=A0ABS5VXZ0_9BACT|nr:phosphoenolpyruvate carboxykinase (ATP) [Chryseosolibacter indicus]MBT1706260.1 phosphoenolpyruvate carboxykinase (ATP) [Chryseosolibacter indicus]